jgi:hypothetical protein
MSFPWRQESLRSNGSDSTVAEMLEKICYYLNANVVLKKLHYFIQL